MFTEGLRLAIEAELGFARFFVRAVTLETVVRKDGKNVPAELDGNRPRAWCGQFAESRQHDGPREAAEPARARADHLSTRQGKRTHYGHGRRCASRCNSAVVLLFSWFPGFQISLPSLGANCIDTVFRKRRYEFY